MARAGASRSAQKIAGKKKAALRPPMSGRNTVIVINSALSLLCARDMGAGERTLNYCVRLARLPPMPALQAAFDFGLVDRLYEFRRKRTRLLWGHVDHLLRFARNLDTHAIAVFATIAQADLDADAIGCICHLLSPVYFSRLTDFLSSRFL
jgi:hypothetical protein